MQPKISVVVITKNEEAHIEQCLHSVKLANEIVIVDDESTDRTVEIGKDYGAKVFIHRMQGFGEQKNYGIDKTSGEWILCIDADEIVLTETWQTIAKTIQNSGDYVGFYILRRNYFLGKWLKYGEWYKAHNGKLVLFKRSAGRYSNGVHEAPVLEGKVGYLNCDIIHHGDSTISQYIQKLDRYTTLELEKMPSDVSKGVVLWLMLYKPTRKFLILYLYRQGFKDGFYGLLMTMYSVSYEFVKYVKYWEKYCKS